MFKLNDKTWVRPETVDCIEILDSFDVAYVQSGVKSVVCRPDEARALLEYLNGALPESPAADVPAGKRRRIMQVEKFISKSGNESWKAESDDVVIYFRQVQKEMLKEAGLWDDLNDMEIGEVCAASIVLYTVPDGDLHKIVSIDPGGAIFFDDDPEDEANQEPIYDPDPDGTAAAMMAFDFDGEEGYTPDDDADPGEMDPFAALVRSGDFVILDTETTGPDDRAEICQIAIIDSSGKTLVDTLVKPRKPIPATATAIHGITNAMVKDAPNWLNVNERVWQALHGKTVIVYNAEYDFRLLAQSEYACEPAAVSDWHTIKRVCAMLKFAEIYGDWDSYRQSWKWQKLETAARHYGLTAQAAHSALGDCLTTLAVVKAMTNATRD